MMNGDNLTSKFTRGLFVDRGLLVESSVACPLLKFDFIGHLRQLWRAWRIARGIL
jgi:hypothetical protein